MSIHWITWPLPIYSNTNNDECTLHHLTSAFFPIGIHPTTISDSFQKAATKATEVLTEMSTPVTLDDRESLLKSATTSLNSKVTLDHLSTFKWMCIIWIADSTFCYCKYVIIKPCVPTKVQLAYFFYTLAICFHSIFSNTCSLHNGSLISGAR